ncbi:N acetyltransferase [Trichuris trichiura]|uniref:N acetyltransferase n=1 Tax=Trichuris trichiura TaxID=36087 RepID=A0A077ZGI0_TRITR|nr:N acetyltransferase [Trichuris trichiura]
MLTSWNQVLLGKPLKGSQGKPLEAKARSLQKRKERILPRYVAISRRSRLLDHRLGEKQKNIDNQEKMAMRFALERQKRFLKTSRFALDDGNSEVLTNWENSLGDLENVHSEDERSDSEEETATLQAPFVEAAHFSDGFQEKSRQEVIQNLIARSKVAKAENKARREEAIAHVELADDMYNSLLQRHKFNCTASEQNNAQEKAVAGNSYDLVLHELVTGGSRSRPSSGKHDPNEVAKAKKEELIRLEQLRKKNSATISSDELATVPYLLEMPDDYEHFCDLLTGHSPPVQCTILNRLITCHHVSFHYENRRLLGKLMLFAIRYFQTVSSSKSVKFELLEQLSDNLSALFRYNKALVANCFAALLTRYNENQTKLSNLLPDFDCFTFLLLVKRLFIQSTLWPSMAPPYIVFLAKTLSSAIFRDVKDVGKALLASSILLAFVRPLKRYVPELVTTLRLVLLLGSDKTLENEQYMFPVAQPGRNLLLIESPAKCLPDDTLHIAKIFSNAPVESEYLPTFQMTCLKCAITLATASLELYADLPCITEISILLQTAAEMLPAEHLVGTLSNVVGCFKAVVTTISSARGTLKPLALESTVKQFRTLEPKIEANFDPIRQRRTKDEEEKRRVLSRKYKREFRGAVRELKRDNEFLARHRLKETMQRDAYRKEKTNQIMRDLVQQQAEHRKLKRTK